MNSHSIRRLLPSASFVGCGDLLFQRISCDSRQCEPGTLFVAVPGSKHDGRHYIHEAVSRGACGVLTSVPLVDINVPQCVVSDIRRCYGWICQYLAGQPAKSLDLLGVTGTNGKTTISWMLRSILRAASKRTGLLGTIEYDDAGNCPVEATMTTPDPHKIADWLGQMVRHRATHAVMEVSSHALDQRRIAGLSLRSAIISNISHDHLDYHGDLKSYMLAKSSIQDYCRADADFIINGDDLHIQEMLKMRCGRLEPVTVGFSERNQFQISPLEQTVSRGRFALCSDSDRMEFTLPLPCQHNMLNAALAAATALKLGMSVDEIQAGIEQGSLPPGRMQRISAGQSFDCFVDYAHTPDAIEHVVRTMKSVTAGRLICLFGAGGNRDSEKRPLMAKAAQSADVIILTADNSREEPTHQIIDDICRGFENNRTPELIEEDRTMAIQWAVDHAQPGDCVLILEKGHEKGQEINGVIHPFDDRIEVKKALANRFSLPDTPCVKVPA